MALDITTLSVKVQAQGINDTAKALDNLALSAEKAEKSADRLGEKFSKSSTGILAIKSAMEGMKDMMSKAFPTEGAQALNRALGELSATLKTIKGKKIDIDVGGIGRDAEVARKGVESLNRSLMEGHNVFQVVGKSLYQLRNMLGGTMLFAALQNTTGAVIKFTDSWSLMSAKLNLALGSTVKATAAQEELYKSAQNLRVPIEDMSKLFVRLVPAMTEYGYSVSDALSVTRAMSAALSLSGATAAETSSVLLQFSQAMQAGRLNGAEFNAVAEGAPVILRAIQKELLVSRKALKDMGADGEISVNILTDVLKKYEKQWVDTAANMPLTFDKAMTKLENAFKRFLGMSGEAQGTVGLISKAIDFLANNLGTLLGILGTVAAAFITYNGLLLAYNIIVATSTALSNSLAISLGITAEATGAAAGAVGLLNGALKFLMANPVIIALTAIAAGYVYLSMTAEKVKTPLEEINGVIEDTLKLGDAAPAKFKALIKEQEDVISKATKSIEDWKAKKKDAYGYQDVVYYNERIKEQQKLLEGATEKQKEYAKALEETNNRLALSFVSKNLQDLRDRNALLDEQIEQNKKFTSSEEARFKASKEHASSMKAITEALEKDPKADVTILRQKADEQRKVTQELDKIIVKELAISEIGKERKRAEKAEESLEKKYTKELNSVSAFIQKQEEELFLKRKLTEAEAEAAKIQAFLNANKSKGSAVEELKALREKVLANGKLKESQEDLNKALDRARSNKLLDTQAAENTRIEAANLQDQVEMLKLVNDETYKSVLAIEMRKQALQSLSMEAVAAATKELEVEKARVNASGAYSKEEKDRRINALNEQIAANDRIIKQYNDLLPLQKQLTEGMFKASQIKMQEIGRSPAQILADGFGEAGKAISTMITAYKDFGKESSAVNAELAGQLEFIQKNYQGEEAAKKTVKATQRASDKQIQITAGMYASMAGAAKGFFSENSKGYQLMEKAEKAFHVVELAMATKSFLAKAAFMAEEVATKLAGETMKQGATEATTVVEIAQSAARAGAKAIEAVVSAFAAPFPLNFASGAAMIAIMAGLGFAVSGGGGSTAPSSADRQSQQGTGTVFGDTGAKSESLTKALENISENSDISLQYNEGMLNALKNIEASIGGVTKQVIRQGVQGQVGFAAGMGTTKSEGLTSFAKAGEIGLLLSSVFAPLNAIVGALFSVKKSVVDSGLIQNAQSLAEVMAGGLDVMGYTDIETKKKKFGRTKTSTETNLSELSEELQNQFSNIIIGMGTAVKEAASVLQMDGGSFTDTLNSFVVDIGRISIQGMDAEQIQETLTNVFSKVGDEMAASVFPGLIEFQNVGEGMLETLIRVSSTVATVDGIFNQIGQSIGGVGLEGAAAKLKLVDLAGGLQELSNLTQGFYDNFYTETEKTANKTRLVTEEFSRLGVEMIDLKNPDARINFRTLIESLKDTNQEAYVGLLKLQESVSDLTPEFKAAETAIDLTNQKLSLQDKINQMTMSSSQYLALQRQKELDAMDESLRPLQLRIYALEDEKNALEKLKAASSGAMSVLEKSVNAQKKVLKKDLDDKVTNLNFVKQYEDRKYEDEKKGLQEAQKSSAAYYDALKTQTDDKYDAEKTVLQEAKKASDAYYDALKQSASNQVDAAKTYRDVVKSLFEDINSAVEKLTDSTSVLQQQTYESAKSQLDVALALAQTTGQLPTGDSFKNVLSTLTGNDSSRYSSMFDFQREQLVNAGKLSALGGITGGKLSTAEAQLLAAENNVKAVEDMAKRADINNDLLMTDLDDKQKEDIKAVEDMANRADAYYDLAIEDLDLKHKETIKILDDQIKHLQEKYDSDVEYFDNMLQNARDQLDIANGTYIATLDVGSALNNFGAALGAYVAAKDIENARLVEQVNSMSKKTTAIDATANKTASDYNALAEEMSQMRADINAGNRAIATNTLTAAKVLSQWDGDGQPETRNVA